MESNPNSYKFVALVNKKIEPAIALNAIGHAAVGLGARLSVNHLDEMKLLNFLDRDGQEHPNISALSFIILKGTSGNIRTLRNEAITRGIVHVDFITTMTNGSYIEQLERTAQFSEGELVYSAIVLFGQSEVLTPLTKKYSLYR